MSTSVPNPPHAGARWAAACLMACVLSLPACRSKDPVGVKVTLQVTAGAPRPDYVVLTWFTPSDNVGSTHRFPERGALAATGGASLGSVFFEVAAGRPGDRRVLAVGMAAERAVSFAAARVLFDTGEREVTLVLGDAPPDSDGDGLPDVIDDDCVSPSCAPGPRRDGGVAIDGGDGGIDAPVSSEGVDAARVPMPLAAACAVAEDCESGFCADGVCCDAACAGACEACNLAGAQGRCTPIPAGEDPGEDCPNDPPATCGRDGTCDGKRACRLLAEGTRCVGAACAGSAFTPPRTCDGKGVCRAAAPTTCGGYVCASAEACNTRCTTNAECSTGNVCVQGACSGPKPIGAACAAAGECVSEHCHQGICCATACTGSCVSCNVAGSVGSCAPIPAGQDPLNQCSDAGATSCGTDGACDGTGKCRSYAAGTTCAPAACSGSTAMPARTCDGSGTCRAAVTVACAPYVCNGTQCRTSCTDDAQCTSGGVCLDGVCTPKRSNGQACTVAKACSSGVCASGVCCDRACGGVCEACNLSGSVGICKLVAAGTVCAAGACTQATQTPASTCSSAGACVAASPVSCGRYQCAGASCRTGCLADADCVAPNACGAGQCGGLRGEYFDNQDLTAPVLTRVDPRIFFDWGGGSPATNIDPESFSVRWTGTLTPRFSEPYQITIGSDDGVRLWIDGTLVVDAWSVRSYGENTATVSLMAGHAHDIKIEYFDQTVDATVHLYWQSASQPRDVVPASALTPPP